MPNPDPTALVQNDEKCFGDTAPRFRIYNDGTQLLGPGNSSFDSSIGRAGTNTIGAGPNFLVGPGKPLGDNGVGELQLANATTPPTTNPTGGLDLYAAGGLLTYRNPQGLVCTVTGSQGGITAPVTVANTTVESALSTFAMPANDAVATAVYRVMGWGVYSTTGTPTLAWTVRLGGVAGTILASIPAITTAALTNAPFKYEVMLNFLSSTSVQAVIDLDFDTSTAADSGTVYVATPSAPTVVSLSSTQNLVVDVTWGTASASNTISLLGGYSERVA